VIMPDHPFRETKAWPALRADAVRAVAALRAALDAQVDAEASRALVT